MVAKVLMMPTFFRRIPESMKSRANVEVLTTASVVRSTPEELHQLNQDACCARTMHPLQKSEFVRRGKIREYDNR